MGKIKSRIYPGLLVGELFNSAKCYGMILFSAWPSMHDELCELSSYN